ncbi:MAG: UDP-glucose 4-epimerase GalE [Thermomicrobiales bacterium]
MTVLITGGAGYIGSITARQLIEAGEDVIVFDNLEHGSREAVAGMPFMEGDIRDAAALEQVMRAENVDAVIHLAAYKSVAESMEAPERYFRNNVGGTLTLLETMVRCGVEIVVFSSTCAVYGTPEHLPVTESTPVQPESPYAESKLMGEQMLKWFDQCHDIRSASLRYFNAAGATMEGEIGEDPAGAANLIPIVLSAVLDNERPVTVFGTDYPTPDGSGVRDYVHVLDLADAHLRSLEYLRSGGSSTCLNIGTGIGVSVLEIIEKVEEASGLKVPVEYGARREGDPASSWADPGKARETLGWTAKHGLDDIISSAWNWQSSLHATAVSRR